MIISIVFIIINCISTACNAIDIIDKSNLTYFKGSHVCTDASAFTSRGETSGGVCTSSASLDSRLWAASPLWVAPPLLGAATLKKRCR